MKRNLYFTILVSGLVAWTLLPSHANAQSLTTSFPYQGELSENGSPANGTYDLQFRALSAATGGTQVGPTLCADDVAVANGRFTTALDFGGIFGGQRLFLEVGVRSGAVGTCASTAGYTTLAPLQELTAAPYATYAVSAAQASTLGGQPRSFFQDATNLTLGTIPDARLSGNVARTNTANVFAGSVQAPIFIGTLTGNATSATTATTATNATNLNGQPASFYQSALSLTSGILADARLSANVPRIDAANTFVGSSNTFQNTVNFLSAMSAINASNTLASAQLVWLSDVPTLRVAGTGTGAANGLAFATASTANAMRITDTGSVGINNSAPLAPLHVSAPAGITLGRVVVAPGAANSNSELFLSENTTTSIGATIRYEGALNQIQFLGRSANVDSAPHMVIERDTSRVGVGLGAGGAPSTTLDVNGVIRSRTGGVQFPDGRTQSTAAVNPGQLGFSSGYPAGSTLSITLNGVAQPTASLVGSFRITRPGGAGIANWSERPTLRRPRTSDTSWYEAVRTATAQSGLVFTVTVPAGGTMTYTLPGGMLHTYRVLTGDDGLPLEEVVYACGNTSNGLSTNPAVATGTLTGIVSPGINPRLGDAGGQSATYRIVVNSVIDTQTRVVGNPSFLRPVDLATGVPSGALQSATYRVRANAASAAQNFDNWVLAGAIRTSRLILDAATDVNIVNDASTSGLSWGLTIADDGLPVEEIELILPMN